MVHLDSEPSLRVGLLASDGPVGLELKGAFKTGDGQTLTGGKLVIESDPSGVAITGEQTLASASQIRLSPDNLDECRFTVDGITIGIDFHWEQKESQSFQGHIEAARAGDVIQIVNEVPIESYLAGVISSEMSASCPGELLRAHAVVSRSWLLAQVRGRPLPQLNEDAAPARPANAAATTEDAASLVRWYGRESHQGFDVCADDHCQRYQGTGKAFSGAVFDAIRDTRGTVLVFEEEICDARYSKCCGGMTERYSAAWDDKDVPYLAPIYDGPDGARSASFTLPLTTEQNAGRWIRSSPPAYCDTQSEALLSTILTGFDQKTRDFYRW
ncbi:MAG TPA: SpoIID/LytB domain-containing protein, partial [Blastocatellia bacterium]